MRRLFIILGDQLDRESLIFKHADLKTDHFWMAEVAEESTHVWSHKQRIALFLSAMRHFADELQAKDYPLTYLPLDQHEFASLGEALNDFLASHQPEEVWLVKPGDYRVFKQLADTCKQHDTPIKQLHDQHFLSTPAEFKTWAGDKKQLRLEYWYRQLRKQYQVLMQDEKTPEGGKWNYDQSNRKSFGKAGPQAIPKPIEWPANEITKSVVALVNERFPEHPGELAQLQWPVTPEQAKQALTRFLDQALPEFGDFQDAMWTGEPFLNHSLIASSLNLKLLHPLQVIQQAEQRYCEHAAPLAAVEGFIRQILGWREYVRGLYWLHMPEWLELNALDAHQDLPAFYWTGDTPMTCLSESIGQTLKYGYAHHIQRLMVTGLFALLYGVAPRQVHEWYLAVYVDAVEWVELPNTLGMSQYADNGIMASKPYAASGQYINRMSNYCKQCPFNPALAVGEKACPITTLYWDFLDTHRERLQANPRMGFMMKNLEAKSDEDIAAIKEQAVEFRKLHQEA